MIEDALDRERAKNYVLWRERNRKKTALSRINRYLESSGLNRFPHEELARMTPEDLLAYLEEN